MIIKYIAGLYAALALVVLLSARYVQQSVASAEPSESIGSREPRPSPQSPFPDVCIPGVPEKGDCCLWEIVRKVGGKREAKYGSPYNCDVGQTRRGEMWDRMKLTIRRY